MTSVTVANYGIGNLLSVCHAFEHIGAQINLTSDLEAIENAERLVIPGVGAFARGMDELAKHHMIDPIKKAAQRGCPILGICLGMQLLFETSDEFYITQGLGLIPGHVTAIPATGSDGVSHKIPHIGWAELQAPASATWDGTILKNIHPGDEMYFVHSFAAHPSDEKMRLADVSYNGRLISACVKHGNIYGCQFHPEKSGPKGLNILKAFIEISG